MSDLPPVQVDGVSLAYRLARNQAGTIKEFAVQLLRRQVKFEKLWAVSDVSFEVQRGETLALIGRNGAGKTTLMKIIARVLPPTDGRVVVRGHVAPMISLGAGFNHELTGYENIILYGTLLGRDPETMRKRVGPIAEWADLADFMDVPVRAYSSGMLARYCLSTCRRMRIVRSTFLSPVSSMLLTLPTRMPFSRTAEPSVIAAESRM